MKDDENVIEQREKFILAAAWSNNNENPSHRDNTYRQLSQILKYRKEVAQEILKNHPKNQVMIEIFENCNTKIKQILAL